MIWNIFKKDWKRLWNYAAALAVYQIVAAANLSRIGSDTFGNVSRALELTQKGSAFIVLAGGSFLIGLIALQDPIPGVGQDWLVRPIRRRDLLLAKLLTIAMLIHVPMFAADALYGVTNHFPIGQALTFAASRSILIFVVMSIPILALFSLTRNFIEAIVMGLIMAAGFMAIMMFSYTNTWRSNWNYFVTGETDYDWVSHSAGYVILIAGAAVILVLQYFRRRTSASRIVAVIAWFIFVAVSCFLPWNMAYAIGEKFSLNPNLGEDIKLTFDSAGERFKIMPQTPDERNSAMYLPLKVTGMPEDSFLRADVYMTRAYFPSGDWRELSLDQKADFSANGPGYLKIEMAPFDWRFEEPLNDSRLKTQPMQLEIELWMTLFQAVESSEMHSMGAPMTVNGVTCLHSSNVVSTAWDDLSEMEVDLGCTPVPKPYCYTAVFKDPPAPYVNRPALSCGEDYKPFLGKILPGGTSIQTVTYLRDPARIVRYPAGSQDLFKSKIILTSYRPVDHFKRKLVIPNIRRSDWTAVRLSAN